jgi:hypothetical protein
MNDDQIRHVMKMSSGASETKEARDLLLKQLAYTMHHVLNLQVKTFQDLRLNHVVVVIQYWLTDGIDKRTILNRMAHIRTALKVFKCQKLLRSPDFTNGSLGLSGASREGTHVALPKELFEHVYKELKTIRPGGAIVLLLQWTFGLRMQEAIQSSKSVHEWIKTLKNWNEIRVVYGTKTGRPRTVYVGHGEMREKAIECLEIAIEYLDSRKSIKYGKYFIPSKGLEAAEAMYGSDISKFGMTEAQASQSLRYAWADRRFQKYQDDGLDESNALAHLSVDLGHGDGRGRYIKRVYLRERFPKKSILEKNSNGPDLTIQ